MYLSDVIATLLESGFLPEEELQSYQKWVDVKRSGFSISFYFKLGHNGPEVDGSFSVHENLNNIIHHANSLESAISLARVKFDEKR